MRVRGENRTFENKLLKLAWIGLVRYRSGCTSEKDDSARIRVELIYPHPRRREVQAGIRDFALASVEQAHVVLLRHQTGEKSLKIRNRVRRTDKSIRSERTVSN